MYQIRCHEFLKLLLYHLIKFYLISFIRMFIVLYIFALIYFHSTHMLNYVVSDSSIRICMDIV